MHSVNIKNYRRDVYGVQSQIEKQIGGDHYSKFKDYQPWVVLSKWLSKEELIGAMKKDVIKYLMRNKTDQWEDIKKAQHTLNLVIELLEEKCDTKLYKTDQLEDIKKVRRILNLVTELLEGKCDTKP